MDWVIFLTTFGILFLGELGDKTQLIVFNLSLEQEKPYKIGIGATIGFAVIVSLGVFIGAVITKIIPLSIINIISGIVFIVVGLLGIPGIKKNQIPSGNPRPRIARTTNNLELYDFFIS